MTPAEVFQLKSAPTPQTAPPETLRCALCETPIAGVGPTLSVWCSEGWQIDVCRDCQKGWRRAAE